MVGRFESGKDIVQEITESTATHVGRITTIITDAVGQVAKEIGDLITEGVEMRDARKRAVADHERGDGSSGIDASVTDVTHTDLTETDLHRSPGDVE